MRDFAEEVAFRFALKIIWIFLLLIAMVAGAIAAAVTQSWIFLAIAVLAFFVLRHELTPKYQDRGW